MTQAFKYLLLQLLCVSDSNDDADAASIEADSRPQAPNEFDQRPAWERDGYPDEERALSTIERVNDLLRTVDIERRTPIRRWLSARGYPPSLPIPVRARRRRTRSRRARTS
jgi:hypothetical protein